MAGRKGSKTSKTEHVLSLLSGGAPQAAPADAPAPQAAPADSPAAQPAASAPARAAGRPLAPPILEVARTNNEALSETIHLALEEALLEELAPEEAAPPPDDGSPEAPPLPDPPPPPEEPSPQAEARPDSGETSQAGPEAGDPAPAPPEDAPVPPARQEAGLPDGAEFLNVMELLVDEKLGRYVGLFHLCDCPRCLADAKALSLSRLPAKYVVLPGQARSPMMGLYRSRYDGDVTTQIIYACKAVMEHPRHQPDGGPPPSV